VRIGETLGGYVIEAEIGSGSMGTVYRARNGGPVALKVLHEELLESEESVARFRREAEIGRRVEHDNVVRTLDVGADGPHHYLVMELVEGQTLRGLLREMGRVPEDLCRHIGRETARALDAIHALGVVHRDLKPENVLITRDHVVKVMDLGVARLMDAATRLSRTGLFVGSVMYAAPEQFLGLDPDRRADFYALGLVLYELATGRHPFASDSFGDLFERQLQEEPPRLAELNPQVSPFFEEVCHALLRKDPDARIDFLPGDEDSPWWKERAKEIRRETRRPLRRIRIPRETALHGRARELARLESMYDTARGGEGRVVLLEGEAGVGKTRLVDEFFGRFSDGNVLFGGYPPAGAGAGAFSIAFREHFGEEGSERFLDRSPALAPAFDALLRGDPPPEGARPLSEEAVQACFVQAAHVLSAERPTVILADDLHFAPREGRALFLALAHAIQNRRVLLIGTTRPGLEEEWTAGLMRLPHAERVSLERLGARDIAPLVEEALGSRRVAERLGPRIAEKSDGNPFFAFEIIQSLREQKLLARGEDGETRLAPGALDRVAIPSSVAELVAARIDALEDDQRELLDAACCCGFEFDAALVADALGLRRIPGMRRFAGIERRHRLVRSSGRNMVFDHHQIQEALYAELPTERRRRHHAALGEALENRGGGDAFALCDHFLRGGLAERARPRLEAALDELDRAHASEAAIDLALRALAVDGLLQGGERAAILERLAAGLDLVGRWDDEEAVLKEARGLAADPAQRCSVLRRLGLLYRSQDRYDEGLAVLAEAIEEARRMDDRRTTALVTGIRGDVLRRADRYDEAMEHFRRHLSIAKEIGDMRGEMMASGAIGSVLAVTGNREEGKRWTGRYHELAKKCGDERAEAIAAGNVGVDALHMGRFDDARTHLERSLALSRQLGYRMGEARAHGNLAVSLESEGRLADAIDHAAIYLELSGEVGYARGEVLAHNHLAELHAACGEVAKAGDHGGRAVATAQAAGLRNLTGAALAASGYAAEAAGEFDRAQRRYDEAVERCREIGNVEALLPALLKRGALLARLDRAEEARASLAEAAEKAREANLPGPHAIAAAMLAALPGGDAAAARAALEEEEERMPQAARMTVHLHLWKATGDSAHLERAYQLLRAARENAPEACRDRMVNDVALHHDIVVAWHSREDRS